MAVGLATGAKNVTAKLIRSEDPLFLHTHTLTQSRDKDEGGLEMLLACGQK